MFWAASTDSTSAMAGPIALPVGLAIIAGTLGWLLPFPIHHRAAYVLAGIVLITWRRDAIVDACRSAWRHFEQAARTAPRASVAAVMLLGSQEPGRMGDWMLALSIAWAATAIILFSATYLQKWLGTRVLTAIERLMGMVIVAISVQMLLDGISSYLRAGS